MPKKIDTAGLKHFKGKENAMIAGKPESTNTATVAHAVGEYFYWKGVLHIVTAAIAVGGTIQTNTNVKPAVLADDVGALKTALGYGFLNTTDFTGDVNTLGEGAIRCAATSTNIPLNVVGYVVTFARTATTAKVQLYITAPITASGGVKSKLFARNLVSGTWSAWTEFKDAAELSSIWVNNVDYSSDIDNVPDGICRVTETALNNPANEMGFLLTIQRAATAKAQIFWNNNNLYYRISSSGTWGTWQSVKQALTDREIGYSFGDSLMAQDGKVFAYPNPQYNADEIGETCVGWQSYLRNYFGVTITNYAVGGQGIFQQKPIILAATYTGVDFVIISCGINDYSNNVPLGSYPTSQNPTFTSGRFIDDYCESIEYILSQNPNIKILLFTPCQRDTTWRNDGVPSFADAATDIYTANSQGLYVKDYAEAVRKIGEIYSCVVCDMYSDSGLNYLTLPEYTFEGVHPTNEGYKFTSRCLIEAFKKL